MSYDQAPEATVANPVDPATPPQLVEVTPTQVRRPWRATARSVFQLVIALATLLPFIAAGIYVDADQAPAIIGQVLAVAATITRVMALPQVEAFLQTWLPWLAAAEPARPQHRRDDVGAGELNTILVVVLIVLIVVVILAMLGVIVTPAGR